MRHRVIGEDHIDVGLQTSEVLRLSVNTIPGGREAGAPELADGQLSVRRPVLHNQDAYRDRSAGHASTSLRRRGLVEQKPIQPELPYRLREFGEADGLAHETVGA